METNPTLEIDAKARYNQIVAKLQLNEPERVFPRWEDIPLPNQN